MSGNRKGLSYFTCSLLALIMLLALSTFVMGPRVGDGKLLAASTLWTIFLTAMLFLMLRTGKVSRYRSIFFVIYAVSFVVVFLGDLIAERGSMALSQKIIDAHQTPLCPVAIPQLVLPALLKRVLIFPTQMVAGPYGGFWAILTLWLVGLLTLGRGWCSWACFYGGIDEGFAKFLRRPLVSTRRLPERWRLLPTAVLILVVVWSFLALEPVYCRWLCPLKLVTEYHAVDSPVVYLQTVIFVTLGVGLLIVLPVLTGKRIHCGLFCPLGALNAKLAPVNPYRVRIDPETCTGCGRCRDACPTFSITGDSPRTQRVDGSCTRCGRCIDVCPRGAVSYRFVGMPAGGASPTPPGTTRWRRWVAMPARGGRELLEARTLFIFTAVLFGGVLSGGFVSRTVCRVAGWLLSAAPHIGSIGRGLHG
jgi:polyferredoxin